MMFLRYVLGWTYRELALLFRTSNNVVWFVVGAQDERIVQFLKEARLEDKEYRRRFTLDLYEEV